MSDSNEMTPVTHQPGAPPQAGYGYPTPQQGYPLPQGYIGPGYPGQQPPQGYGQQGYGYGAAQPGYYGGPPPPPGPPQGPQAEMWMNPMGTIPNCPPGLEYLTQLDQVLIKQKVEMLEAFVGWESANKYKIFNNQGQQCYYAVEDSNVLCRQCCGSYREFEINILDNAKNVVFSIKRPFKCCSGANWCAMCRCAQDEVTVKTKDGEILGYVRQACSCWKPHYTILDEQQDPKFELWGPCCTCNICMGDVDFPITAMGTEETVAKISKQWTGFGKEYFTDADNFGVTFPMQLDVKLKAVMMAAVFLIDFMYFENNSGNNNQY